MPRRETIVEVDPRPRDRWGRFVPEQPDDDIDVDLHDDSDTDEPHDGGDWDDDDIDDDVEDFDDE